MAVRRFPLNDARVAALHSVGIISLHDLQKTLTALDLRAMIELDVEATFDGSFTPPAPPKGKAC